MKQLFILLTLLPALAFESDEPAAKLNGAFRQTKNKFGAMTEWKTRDSVTVVKVFRFNKADQIQNLTINWDHASFLKQLGS